MQLVDRWAELWRDLEATGKPQDVLGVIFEHYGQPHRHYHTLRHIAHILHEFDSVRWICKNPDAVEMALWFHNFNYDPSRSDNEEWSVEDANEYLRKSRFVGCIPKSSRRTHPRNQTRQHFASF